MLESGRNAGGASGFKLPHKYPDTHTQQMIYCIIIYNMCIICMYIYIYTGTHTYIYIHIFTYTCLHVYMFTCLHVYMFTCLHVTYVYVYVICNM